MPEKNDNEILINVHWEKLLELEKTEYAPLKDGHVLYQLYGSHHLYGRDVLLYLGKAVDMKRRLRQHKGWMSAEYDEMKVYLGSLGKFEGWKTWRTDKRNTYPAPGKEFDPDIIEKVESLLIYSHKPVYNQKNKNSAPKAKNIRIFNTGRLGQLFPEVSGRYFVGGE